jgi:hypothetical protein
MAHASLVFAVSVALSLLAALLGVLALGDLTQLVVSFPREFTYRVFRVRKPLMALGVAAFAVALYLGIAERLAPWWALALYALLFVFFFFAGFLAPTYVMFRTHQHTARYVPVAEVTGKLPDDAEVMVIEIDGDARAFPNAWIQRPHVAGDVVGGESVLMTYCALSHLGTAFRNDLEGRPLELKVMTQLENNLILFDTVSQEPIEQIHGCLVGRGTPLDRVPATTMPLAAFRALYPEGKVFYNPPAGFLDRRVRAMMDRLLFAKGAHFDPENPKPVFPTIRHVDPRVPPKEQVCGVVLDGRAVAFTTGYLERHGNAVTERVGSQPITVKRFPEHGFVDVFYGDGRDVDPRGYDPDGSKRYRVPHASRVLWMIWANSFRDTEVRA